jgi:predicted methyltransferase
VIRLLIAGLVIGAVGIVVWWDRTDSSKLRQIFFSLYNKALAKAKDKEKLYGVSVNILDVIDETDIPPTRLHAILKNMEANRYVKVTQNTVKLTQDGVAYFKFKYLSEKINEVS